MTMLTGKYSYPFHNIFIFKNLKETILKIFKTCIKEESFEHLCTIPAQDDYGIIFKFFNYYVICLEFKNILRYAGYA